LRPTENMSEIRAGKEPPGPMVPPFTPPLWSFCSPPAQAGLARVSLTDQLRAIAAWLHLIAPRASKRERFLARRWAERIAAEGEVGPLDPR
jgi:hypothetical protein